MPFTRVSPKVNILHHVLGWIYNVPRGPVFKGVVPRTAVLKQDKRTPVSSADSTTSGFRAQSFWDKMAEQVTRAVGGVVLEGNLVPCFLSV